MTAPLTIDHYHAWEPADLDIDWLIEPDDLPEDDDMPTSLAYMADDLADVPFPDDPPYTLDDLDRDERLLARL